MPFVRIAATLVRQAIMSVDEDRDPGEVGLPSVAQSFAPTRQPGVEQGLEICWEAAFPVALALPVQPLPQPVLAGDLRALGRKPAVLSDEALDASQVPQEAHTRPGVPPGKPGVQRCLAVRPEGAFPVMLALVVQPYAKASFLRIAGAQVRQAASLGDERGKAGEVGIPNLVPAGLSGSGLCCRPSWHL